MMYHLSENKRLDDTWDTVKMDTMTHWGLNSTYYSTQILEYNQVNSFYHFFLFSATGWGWSWSSSRREKNSSLVHHRARQPSAHTDTCSRFKLYLKKTHTHRGRTCKLFTKKPSVTSGNRTSKLHATHHPSTWSQRGKCFAAPQIMLYNTEFSKTNLSRCEISKRSIKSHPLQWTYISYFQCFH